MHEPQEPVESPPTSAEPLHPVQPPAGHPGASHEARTGTSGETVHLPGGGIDLSGLMVAAKASPASTDLVAIARSRVTAACESHGQGEQVEHAVGLITMPGAQGQPIPMFAILIAIRSIVLDQRIHATHLLQNLWADQRVYDDLVRQSVDQLLQARSQMATQANGMKPSP